MIIHCQEERTYQYPKGSTGDRELDEKLRTLVVKFKAISVVRSSLINRLVANGKNKIPKNILDDTKWLLNLGLDAHKCWISLEKENASPPTVSFCGHPRVRYFLLVLAMHNCV